MKSIVAIAAFVIAVVLIVFGPILTIWAFNTLFPSLLIPYTWQTWAATIVAVAAVRGFSIKRS